MAYIFEESTWFTDEKEYKGSLLVKNGKIQSIRERFSYYSYYRVETAPFYLSPTHTVLDRQLVEGQANKIKEYVCNQFLKKGITTVIIPLIINYSGELKEKIQHYLSLLEGIAIDTVFCVRIEAKRLSEKIIRECCKEKISLILLDVEHDEELVKPHWGWIKSHLFSYPICFVPQYLSNLDKDERRKRIQYWENVMISNKIPHLLWSIRENYPLSIQVLKKIGVYPKRGNFLVGGEVSYNLYLYSPFKSVDEPGAIHYDELSLSLTVHRERVVFNLGEVTYIEDFGEHLTIKTPAFFV
ncbi:hypothetical protein Q75_08585 [Bacillus coahuilensis p1.1.43]|uniref:Uncharacterized protein n=1 Tax=Bacillus coahuilensis p1.1.43 TaxID=1150625 RepID=A0A147K8V8_9BACI|nr:hypothetical protein [Bacillus coahuilensis]KUP06567.1 hypothetical protein Q75_08585 [Bacillus coahuilensis p1.1.43]